MKKHGNCDVSNDFHLSIDMQDLNNTNRSPYATKLLIFSSLAYKKGRQRRPSIFSYYFFFYCNLYIAFDSFQRMSFHPRTKV